jgi:hypothetical protein
MNGTILDVQPAQNGTSLDVWLVDDASGSMKVNVPLVSLNPCPWNSAAIEASLGVVGTTRNSRPVWTWHDAESPFAVVA